MIFELAHQMALIPLAWLAWLAARGERLDPAWWWLAGAFVVSWLADWGAHVTDPWLVSLVYPVSQAAIVAAVLLERIEAAIVVGTLVTAGVVAVLWRGVGTPDVMVHTVAWGAVAGVAFDRDALGRLRTALLVAFGGGWLAWVGYTMEPGWPTWLGYQAVRAIGIGCFCWAAARPAPRLRLA